MSPPPLHPQDRAMPRPRQARREQIAEMPDPSSEGRLAPRLWASFAPANRGDAMPTVNASPEPESSPPIGLPTWPSPSAPTSPDCATGTPWSSWPCVCGWSGGKASAKVLRTPPRISPAGSPGSRRPLRRAGRGAADGPHPDIPRPARGRADPRHGSRAAPRRRRRSSAWCWSVSAFGGCSDTRCGGCFDREPHRQDHRRSARRLCDGRRRGHVAPSRRSFRHAMGRGLEPTIEAGSLWAPAIAVHPTTAMRKIRRL